MSASNASTSSCTTVRNDVHKGTVHSCLADIVLHNVSLIKNDERKISTYVQNDDLAAAGENFRWRVDVYPCRKPKAPMVVGPEGQILTSEAKHVGVFVALESPVDISISLQCVFSIVDANGRPLRSGQEHDWIFTRKAGRLSTGRGFNSYISHDRLFTGSRPYVINDCLRIQVKLRFMILSGGVISRQPGRSSLVLAKSMAQLLASGEGSDFVLVSNDGVRFKAHQFVLSLQSEVFAAMFTHTMREKEKKECVIEDADGETIGAMMNFLYGQTWWTESVAESLLVLANKYKIAALEAECVAMLLNKLSFHRAGRLVVLGDQLGIVSMKEDVIKYIAGNVEQFVAVGGYEEIGGNVELMKEIQAAVRARKNKRMKVESD